MDVCCLDDFKIQYEKLRSIKAYKDLQAEIINYFFDKTISDLCNGTRLNGHSEVPYIKKRLKGSGGYRVYYLLVIKSDCIYLMFLHPKNGPSGASNIDDDFKAALYKKVLVCIKKQDYYYLRLNDDKKSFVFEHKSESISNAKPIQFKEIIIKS